MLSMLIAYDAAGNVVATLDYLVATDEQGRVTGLVDFEAQERQGKLRSVWEVSDAAGSGTWPEWIGAKALDFRVETDGPRIMALVHKASGIKRERSKIEEAITERVFLSGAQPADLRDILGGPTRPLILDEEGKTTKRPSRATALPVLKNRRASRD